jgi:uncharacterized membrane protein
MGHGQRVRRSFLTGILILVPAWGTFLVVETLFVALDGLIADVFGPAVRSDVPGLGLLTLILLILLSGLVAAQFLGQRLVDATERALERIPVVSAIYATLKGMTDLFKFHSRFGEAPVVVFPFPREGLWALGFAMGAAPAPVQASTGTSLVSVFVPTAIHPLTGYLAFIPREQAIPVDLPPEDAMKLEVSAGLYRPRPGWLSRKGLPGPAAGPRSR